MYGELPLVLLTHDTIWGAPNSPQVMGKETIDFKLVAGMLVKYGAL